MTTAATSAASAVSTAAASAAAVKSKLRGFEFLEKTLKSPKAVVAPMVDQSEYAWRILSRRYKADLCYTPMFHARLFSESANYREENFQTGPEDRPLIVQFCANDAQTLLNAAKLVENDCDAVDINLGCPQAIAKRGHYGSFLMEEWDLIAEMVRTLDQNLNVPVTCKIRIFPEIEKTLRYAKMLEDAGCQLLTVHGRTREMKGHKTGIADWEQIKIIKQQLKIPVFANGNILYGEDVDRCIAYTGVDGVMSAEGNLYNPAIFANIHPPVWKMAEEYLQICKDVPNSANIGAMRAHLFKIFAPCLHEHTDLRTALAAKHIFEDFWQITQEFKERIVTSVNGQTEFIEETPKYDDTGKRILPTWVCQPHFRVPLPTQESTEEAAKGDPSSETHPEPTTITTSGGKKPGMTDEEWEAIKKAREERKRKKDSPEEIQRKLLERKEKRLKNSNGKMPLCTSASCANFGSVKCAHGGLCKSCCRAKALADQSSKVCSEVAELEGESKESKKYICEVHKTTDISKPAKITEASR